MKPSSELFKLVKSLTKSEKRFFKLSSSLQTGEKNYLKLFDAIEKQKEYDEAAIKKQFKGERFIKHLPSEKNHLYKLILKSLRSYSSENSIGSQLREEIKNVEILYEKALYKECGKIIKKAKRLAYKHEKFYYLFELIRWEKQLLEEDFLFGKFDKDLNELIDEEQSVIAKLQNLAEYQILYSKINYVFRKGGYARSEKERDIVEDICNHHLIKGKNTAMSRRAAATCYYIKGLCDIVKYDYNSSFENFSKVVSIFEDYPELIRDIPKQYIKSMNNLLFCYIDQKDSERFFELLKKMRGLKNKPGFSSTDIQMKIFTCTYNAELIAYDEFANYENGVEIIGDIEKGLETYGNKINKEEEILFYYNIAYVYFGAGQFKSALQWINKVINDNESNLRQDVYSFARLINLIIHFELGNYDLLEYLLKSTNRFYKKRRKEAKKTYQFEVTFLKHFKKLPRYLNREEKQLEVLKALKKDLKRIFRSNYEQVALDYFDFLAWVDSKIEGVSFGEVRRQKLEKREAEALEE